MTPRVVLYAVSTFNDLANEDGVFFNQSTDTEKTGSGVVPLKYVENSRRTLQIRAVIEGQSYRP